MSSKRANTLTLEEKYAVLTEVKNGGKRKGEIAAHFGIPKSTLSTILKNRDRIEAAYATNRFEPNSKRLRAAKNVDLEMALMNWMEEVENQNLTLTGDILQEKALFFAKALNVVDFRASKCWLQRFKKRRTWQNEIANGTRLPDVAEGESSANGKKEELGAASSSQPDACASVIEESAQTVAEEPPPKVAKILKPKVDELPVPSLIDSPIPSLNIDEPHQRKAAKPFPKFSDYVFDGKRLVNMGYFIKSLQTLNDHNGRKCNFSDMRVCKEAKDGWNVGIMFTCNLCPTTKVIWMEDPSTKEKPPMPIIFKPKAVIQTFPGQPMKTPVLLQTPAATVAKTKKPTAKAKLPVPLPPPAPQKRPRQPYRSKRKTPTPPPDEDQPTGLQQVSNYPKTLIIGPNTAIRYGPPQNTFTGQLLVPAPAQSQPVINQPQIHVVGQAQLIGQQQDSVIAQSQVPLVDPQVTSIKQELILPDDGMSPSLIDSSSEHARVEMTFCVDQDENTAESGNVPTDTHPTMDETEDIIDVTVIRDKYASIRAVQQAYYQYQLPSFTSMDGNVARGNPVMGGLPIDLNLVKRENTAESGNVPSDTHPTMDETEDIMDVTVIRDKYASFRAVQRMYYHLPSFTSMDENGVRGNAVMGTLPLDLNLVKRENTAESGNVSSDTHPTMDMTEDITATSDTLTNTQALERALNQLSSSTSMDVNVAHGIASTDTLHVDLNLVKKEIDDETL